MQQTNDLETLKLLEKPDENTVIAMNPAGGVVTIELRGSTVAKTSVGGSEEILYAGNEALASKVFASIVQLVSGNGSKQAESFAGPSTATTTELDKKPVNGNDKRNLIIFLALLAWLAFAAFIFASWPYTVGRIFGNPRQAISVPVFPNPDFIQEETGNAVAPTSTPPLASTPDEAELTVEERNAASGQPAAPVVEPVAPVQPVVDLPTSARLQSTPVEVPEDEQRLTPQDAASNILEGTEPAGAGSAIEPAIEEPSVPADVEPVAPAIEPPAAPVIEETAPVTEEPAVPVSEATVPPTTTDTAALPVEDGTPAGTEALGERAVEAAEQFEETQAEAARSVGESGTEQAATELELMKQAMAILSAGNKITPEQAEGLPHDLAASLRSAGAIQTLEEAAAIAGPAATFSIVRLPVNIVDQYRDADGVQTIPQENSWAARGGIVSVPLPGGGDITSPLDLESFGLQP